MRLLLVFLGLALVFLLSWMAWGGALEERFTVVGAVAWLEGTGGWAWLAGPGLLVSDIVLPVPGTVVMSALGYLYGVLLGGLLAAAGSMAAGITGFGLCRLLGERAARKLLGDLEFERGRLLFARGGGWAIALSRALPILPEALACTAGLVRMPFGRFVLALACGSVPIGFLFAAVGAAGKESPGWALAVSLVVPALLWLAARKLVARG